MLKPVRVDDEPNFQLVVELMLRVANLLVLAILVHRRRWCARIDKKLEEIVALTITHVQLTPKITETRGRAADSLP